MCNSHRYLMQKTQVVYNHKWAQKSWLWCCLSGSQTFALQMCFYWFYESLLEMRFLLVVGAAWPYSLYDIVALSLIRSRLKYLNNHDILYIRGAQRINPHEFSHPLTIHLVPPWGWHLWFWMKLSFLCRLSPRDELELQWSVHFSSIVPSSGQNFIFFQYCKNNYSHQSHLCITHFYILGEQYPRKTLAC